MAFVNDIRDGRHCVFQMHVHLVFLTKYRTKGCDGANSWRRLVPTSRLSFVERWRERPTRCIG